MARLPSVKFQQRRLNWFVSHYRLGYATLIVDGDRGPSTRRRTQEVRHYLGEGLTISQLRPDWTLPLRHRTAHPNDRRYPANERARGAARRIKRRAQVRATYLRSFVTRGVVRFDGKPCAAWLVPYLTWARRNGWRGGLNSGWRDPAYSERLCYQMCGAPACPGRCAGRASRHSQKDKPDGAVDVSDYVRFGQLMRRCPYSPRIFNALGPADPVHFSNNGR